MTAWNCWIVSLAALGTTHAFVLPLSSSSSARTGMMLRQRPDQQAGWMSDGPLNGDPQPGNRRTGTYSRPSRSPMSPPPSSTGEGPPFSPGGRAYYPRTQQEEQQMTGPSIRTDREWWEGARGAGADEPFIGSNRRAGRSRSSEEFYPMTNQPGVDPPQRPETVQGGGSRRTWDTSRHDQTQVVLGSPSGRPVYANVEVWEGPNNTPASMRLYSEDGSMRPWQAGFQNTFRSGGSSAVNIRNSGPMEFPVEATISGSYDGSRGQKIGDQIKEATKEAEKQQQQRQMTPTKSLLKAQTLQGGSLKTFSVGPSCEAIRIELFSEGRPMYAVVEMWQGPNNIQQCAEIYSDNGNDRVWSALIPTPGYSCTIAIRNTGPMAYPISATVDAMQMQ
jgi:hypothetical protein